MFTYCNNNPVNMKDSVGNYPVYITTDVETEKNEENSYITTVTFVEVDSENLSAYFYTPPKSASYCYTIVAGVIQISYEQYDPLLLNPSIAASIVREMKVQAEQLHKNSLEGRTTGGMVFELAIHVALNYFGLFTSNTDVTDMGAVSPDSYGYDYNAVWFEHPLKSVSSIVQRLLN